VAPRPPGRLGTPDFVAPKQGLDCNAVDMRADRYRLGATPFFLLAGQPPFPDGAVAQKLLAHHLRTPPDLLDVAPATPPPRWGPLIGVVVLIGVSLVAFLGLARAAPAPAVGPGCVAFPAARLPPGIPFKALPYHLP
jgi:hypothetical protein